ncbi:MAG TPA: response regulator transcription factor [Chitinophagaceae bacterium]
MIFIYITTTNNIIQLAILDDHQIVIDGLKLVLRENPKFVIVAEANSAEEMLKLLSQHNVDVLLTDITMPHGMNGYDLSLQVKKDFPHIKILALSMSEEGSIITKMTEEAEVSGYIPKTSGQQELFTAIETIAAGGKYFSNTVLQQYDIYKKIKTKNEELNLTARELQIIKCIIKHYSNKKIADELFISERTVETHRKNIYRKTNTKGEAALIQFIKEHNLIS